jgi:hypothetical protein
MALAGRPRGDGDEARVIGAPRRGEPRGAADQRRDGRLQPARPHLDHGAYPDRAELIRRQRRIARLGEHDPSIEAERDRVESLLFRNRERWLAELPESAREAPTFEEDARFQRGFAVSAKMTAADFLEQGDALFAATPLEALQLEELLVGPNTQRYRQDVSFASILKRPPPAPPAPADHTAQVLEAPLLERLRRLDLRFNNLGPEHAALIAAWHGWSLGLGAGSGERENRPLF